MPQVSLNILENLKAFNYTIRTAKISDLEELQNLFVNTNKHI